MLGVIQIRLDEDADDVPRDTSENPFFANPVMAIRSDDGSVYVQCRSKYFPKPQEAEGGWMAGWVLMRFDPDGKMLWYRQLPAACPGIDVIPGGGGVMLVNIKLEKEGCDIYHYNQEGSLIGITRPSAAFRSPGGIPDNTASLVISRDPRDGIMDMFVEDCIGNRFYWLRVDDRKKPRSAAFACVSKSPIQPHPQSVARRGWAAEKGAERSL